MSELVHVFNMVARYSPIGTLIGASVAATAFVIKVRQDAKDLRRKQAEVARLVYIDLHEDEYSKAALLMLDFSGWRHTTRDFEKVEIFSEDVMTALTVKHDANRPDKELLVRRAFDTLFGKLENAMVLAKPDICLVRWSDFADLFGYNINNMRNETFAEMLTAYANQYGFRMIVELIKRPDVYPIPSFHDDLSSPPEDDPGRSSVIER
jgi:hypothetical protein